MQNIKNIIFDLGGVVLNIDFKKTEEAFKALGIENFAEHINQFHITELFEKYETGMIDDELFLAGISKLIGRPVEREKIVEAWNALLLDFPPERIEYLKKVKQTHRTFLLSNTNAIHQREFNQRLFDLYGVYLEDLFEKVYYSHVVNLRKPGADIFRLLLRDNNIEPDETLFIDDTYSNFPEAMKLGIHIHHLKPGESIADISFN